MDRQLTLSNIEALAHKTPPRTESELAGFIGLLLKFLVELTAIITSSAPSQFSTDHPSSLNPLTASLKPLHEYGSKRKFTSLQSSYNRDKEKI